MAQDFKDMGERSVFPIDCENWATSPRTDLHFGLAKFSPGGIDYIKQIKPVARTWQVTYTAQAADLVAILFFFTSQRGRFKSFWWPAPNYLQYPSFEDAENLSCDGDLTDAGIGYVYVKTLDGDEVGRRVLDTNYSALTDKTTFTFAEIEDIEGIATAEIDYVRELVFVTFGSDILELKYLAGDLAEITLTFLETFGEKESLIEV